jgi:hypothetical protein
MEALPSTQRTIAAADLSQQSGFVWIAADARRVPHAHCIVRVAAMQPAAAETGIKTPFHLLATLRHTSVVRRTDQPSGRMHRDCVAQRDPASREHFNKETDSGQRI